MRDISVTVSSPEVVLAFITDEGRHAVVALDAEGIAFDLRWVTFE